MLLNGVLTSAVQEEIGSSVRPREPMRRGSHTPLLHKATQTKRLLVLGIHFLIYVVMLVRPEQAYVCFSCSAFSVLFVTELGS